MAHAKELADRPAHREKEIEITPEMIEAGVLALCSFDPRFEDEEEAVRRIFSEMTKPRNGTKLGLNP